MDENGQSIWEETISTAKLQELKDNPETKDIFYTQYQQEPVIAGGNKFKEEMFAVGDMPDSFDWHYIIADTAYKDGEDNDDTVFVHYGIKDKKFYLNDILVAHIEAKDIEAYCVPFITKHNEYGFRGAYIEDKGHGIYLNQKLPSQVPMPSKEEIKEFFQDRKLNKVERANNVLPFMASQVIIINRNIPEKIIEKIIKQCLNFPKDKHDDIVDVIIDGIKLFYLNNKPSILDVL
jgi:predicted phage terminase large subunit-like protein